jgi:hypothetical protein
MLVCLLSFLPYITDAMKAAATARRHIFFLLLVGSPSYVACLTASQQRAAASKAAEGDGQAAGARFTNFQELFFTRILNAILNRLRIDS